MAEPGVKAMSLPCRLRQDPGLAATDHRDGGSWARVLEEGRGWCHTCGVDQGPLLPRESLGWLFLEPHVMLNQNKTSRAEN